MRPGPGPASSVMQSLPFVLTGDTVSARYCVCVFALVSVSALVAGRQSNNINPVDWRRNIVVLMSGKRGPGGLAGSAPDAPYGGPSISGQAGNYAIVR